jgi:hypothetical protein
LRTLGVPVMVLAIAEPGAAGTIEPGVMGAEADRFHVLEAGRIQEGLARL